MPRIAYVNGRYQPHIRASVHIEDRGFQFADGVYEVIAVSKGQLVDIEPHLDRLDRSLGELDIKWPVHRRAFRIILAEVIRRNRVVNGSVYLQVTRGVAPRDFAYSDDLKPSLIVYARRAPKDTIESASKGHKVVSKPDIRWKRCDIKTVSLLPAVMAKQAAVGEGAIEAWLVNEEGIVTEGTSSNAWIVTPEKELVTRQTDNLILSGITRQTVATLAASAGLTFVERPFSLEDAKKAQEAFCTSSTALVKPIVEIDGTQIGNGEVGPITRQLIEHYLSYMDNPA
ncbi:MAG: D-amino-acid transaminase [Rhodospirillaceae bacterium]|jgi:D-alanine transaminase|nr:D-amino-acid transaminase [Rhodospirillaceae bacterium]MBT7267015.1 D-amino-acid transaminase [Rhodospirillaceae bacterium]